MLAQELRKEEAEVRRAIAAKLEKDKELGGDNAIGTIQPSAVQTIDYSTNERKRRRWDDDSQGQKGDETPVASKSDWDKADATPIARAGGFGEETPGGHAITSSAKAASSRWDVTPAAADGNATGIVF